MENVTIKKGSVEITVGSMTTKELREYTEDPIELEVEDTSLSSETCVYHPPVDVMTEITEEEIEKNDEIFRHKAYIRLMEYIKKDRDDREEILDDTIIPLRRLDNGSDVFTKGKTYYAITTNSYGRGPSISRERGPCWLIYNDKGHLITSRIDIKVPVFETIIDEQ
jgi:hypothetical protein